VSLRELTDKYLPSTLDLYIAIDMGTRVVGDHDVDGQVAHPACDCTNEREVDVSMLHQRYIVLADALPYAV
jgi:hypothetical protein